MLTCININNPPPTLPCPSVMKIINATHVCLYNIPGHSIRLGVMEDHSVQPEIFEILPEDLQ